MKRKIYFVLGVLLSTLPPTVLTLSYFPLWVRSGAEETVSGLCAFMLVLCAFPLLRILSKRLSTPSLPIFWGIFYLFLKCLGSIITELTVISFVGLCANLVGGVFFHLAKARNNE